MRSAALAVLLVLPCACSSADASDPPSTSGGTSSVLDSGWPDAAKSDSGSGAKSSGGSGGTSSGGTSSGGASSGGTSSGGANSGGSSGHCCKLVSTQLAVASPCGPSQADSPWQTLDNAGCNDSGGCQKIWCPFEKCDTAKHPGGCPQGTEVCWVNDGFANYEDACRSCCESYGACWDTALSTCRHPDDCGSPLWKCPWQP